jgi:hypothetical protein
MLPNNTLNNWGNSSSLYFLKKIPDLVIAEMLLDAIGLRTPLLAYMVFILYTLMMLACRPTRLCIKKPLLRVSMAAMIQHRNINGIKIAIPTEEKQISKILFNKKSVFDIFRTNKLQDKPAQL